jgi:hypothetical protein
LTSDTDIAAGRDGARDNGVDSILIAQRYQCRNGRQVATVCIVVGIASRIPRTGIVATGIASVCNGDRIAVTIRASVCIAITIRVTVRATVRIAVSVFLFFFLFLSDFFVSGNRDIACAGRPVKKSEWRRIGIFHYSNVKVRISAQVQQSEFVFELCAPTEHPRHEACGRNLPEVIRAAYADGRKRCFDSVGFLVRVAYGSCNGAKAAWKL